MMNIIAWKDVSGLAAFQTVPCALTVGVFDGVHIGHRAILDGLVRPGSDLLPVIITFSRLPHNVLDPAAGRKMLLTMERKLGLLGALGVAVAVMIDFSVEFSKMTATSFFETLAAAFQIRKVVEGENFHFGRAREAGRQALAGFCDRIGASLETAGTVFFKGLPVSSTRIRHAVQAGLIEDVRAMLTGAYPVDLPADAAFQDATGITIVEKKRLDQAVPEQGVYRCRMESGTGPGEVEVAINKERIFIRTRLPSIKTLYFEEKIKPDFQ